MLLFDLVAVFVLQLFRSLMGMQIYSSTVVRLAQHFHFVTPLCVNHSEGRQLCVMRAMWATLALLPVNRAGVCSNSCGLLSSMSMRARSALL